MSSHEIQKLSNCDKISTQNCTISSHLTVRKIRSPLSKDWPLASKCTPQPSGLEVLVTFRLPFPTRWLLSRGAAPSLMLIPGAADRSHRLRWAYLTNSTSLSDVKGRRRRSTASLLCLNEPTSSNSSVVIPRLPSKAKRLEKNRSLSSSNRIKFQRRPPWWPIKKLFLESAPPCSTNCKSTSTLFSRRRAARRASQCRVLVPPQSLGWPLIQARKLARVRRPQTLNLRAQRR